MTRNLKAMGLALVALFAISAMAASSASAANDHFTSTNASAVVTGVSHDNSFHYPNGVGFNCTTSKFTGTTTNGSTELTIDPEYTGLVNATPHGTTCTATGGEVTIDMNGCHYVLTGNTTGADPVGTTDATVWITCPVVGGVQQVIKITQAATGITFQVPPQTPTTGGVTYTNEVVGGKKVVKVKATATGVTTLCHPAFICGLAGVSTHENDATYTGTVVGAGWEDPKKAGEPITPLGAEGTQVNIEVSST
jgi:hypothetical protein